MEMVYVDEAGAYVYLLTTERSLDWGFIGLGEYSTRLAYLRGMLEPRSELHILVSKYLRSFEEESPRDSLEDTGSPSSASLPKLEPFTEGNSQPPEDEPLHLATDQAGVLGKKWIFHPNDMDFFPSVPHGHLKTRTKVKLDAYRGYTYDTACGNAPLARETRDFIIGLWRDDKFRILATETVKHFVTRHRDFNWWSHRRILDPLHLPPKR